MSRRLDLDEDKIKRLYVEDGWTAAMVGDFFRVSNVTIINRLDEMGIPRRPATGYPVSEQACELCGKSLHAKNMTGVCSRPGCEREYTSRRQRSKRARKKPLLARRAHARHLNSKHEDVAYLYYSPGLRSHKIGHTTNVKVNEQGLRRACWDIQLIGTWPGGAVLEGWLHEYFAARRIHGEWFRDLTASEVRKAVAEWAKEADVA